MNWKIEGGELVFCDESGERAPHYSIDEKPIDGVLEGIIIHEDDTDDLYMFREKDKVWVKLRW